MSQAWMTKYRPINFDHVVGQDQAVTILKGMLKGNFIVSSVILEGDYGTGKTSLARLTSKSLLCLTPTSDGLFCDTCDSCLAFQVGNNVNYIERDAASSGKVNDIRELVKLCAYPPLGSPKRVIVLDEAHRVTPEGWNALLKTLEEAVQNTVFLFCTTESDKVPDNIRSRSRSFKIHLLKPSVVIERLKYVLAAEGILDYEPEALEAIAEATHGHMRDALNILEQAYISGGITTDQVTKLTCRVDTLRIKEILDTLIQDRFKIFGVLPEWLQYMSPADIALSVHDIIMRHQLAYWKLETQGLLPGWGDAMTIINWLATSPIPTTPTQLQNFMIQLISNLKYINAEGSPEKGSPTTGITFTSDQPVRAKPLPVKKAVQGVRAPVLIPREQSIPDVPEVVPVPVLPEVIPIPVAPVITAVVPVAPPEVPSAQVPVVIPEAILAPIPVAIPVIPVEPSPVVSEVASEIAPNVASFLAQFAVKAK